MPYLIETANQEVEHLVGQLTIANIALRAENERLQRENEELKNAQSKEASK